MILAWTGEELSRGQTRDWHTDRHTHTDAGNDNTRRPKLASGKNCCEAFIQMKWVLFPIAMNRSSGYNPICCPAISAKLWCFEIPCQVEKLARRACALIPDVTIPWFDLPNSQSELVCRTVWFVDLAYRACVSHAHNPDVNNYAVNQREYQTFDVIKSIAIECVRAQQGVHKISTILGAVIDSQNSKTIEQRRSDSGRRFGDDCECNTGPNLDPN